MSKLAVYIDQLHMQGKDLDPVRESVQGQLKSQTWVDGDEPECVICGDPLTEGHPVARCYDGQGIAHLMCVCLGTI